MSDDDTMYEKNMLTGTKLIDHSITYFLFADSYVLDF